MRLVISQKSVRLMLRSAQCILAAAAVSMLGYCAVVLVDGWTFQNRERRHLEQLVHERQAANVEVHPIASSGLMKRSPLGTTGGLIGRIEVPRLGLSVMVIEGTSTTTLRRAVGHIPGTALPGQPGNMGISGHRDAYFRPLRNIRQNDVITLTTPLGEYRYRVVSTRVVSPSDVAVLDSSADEILTLVTCYPFYFVGPAPSRFIVRAERVT